MSARVTIHMVASLDGFVARRDGGVDWLETADEFPGGETLTAEEMAAFVAGIDCYVMGARTYEVALNFHAKGFGWAYGDKPTVVLTHRDLPRHHPAVELHAGDPAPLIGRLRAAHRSIWIAGGPDVASACLRAGVADELHYSIVPALIGEGIPFFGFLPADVPLHLLETKAYRNGMVSLRYEIRRSRPPV